MTNIFLGIKATELKIWFPNGELWGTTPKQPLERNHAAKESTALQTLHCELKQINSEKLTGVYFALYDGSFSQDNIWWEIVRLGFTRGLLLPRKLGTLWGDRPPATSLPNPPPLEEQTATGLEVCLVPRGHQTFIHLISRCQQPHSRGAAVSWVKGGWVKLTVMTVI